jgi:hypothetical protein
VRARRLGATTPRWQDEAVKNVVDLGVDASRPGDDTRMRWVMYQGQEDLGPVLAVEQQIHGAWHSTGGSWYLETLVSGGRWSGRATGDSIPIDFGARWYAYNLQDALVAATQRLKVGGLGGLGGTPRVLLEKRTGNYHLTLVTTGEDAYSLGVTYTGDWGSGAPVIVDLEPGTPEEDVLWAWKHQLRGDHDVEAMLIAAGYDLYTNERPRSFNGIGGTDLAVLAAWANAAGRLSRRGGAPLLSPDATTQQLLAWHAWNDPNGEWRRLMRDGDTEDLPMPTHGELWEYVEQGYLDDPELGRG